MREQCTIMDYRRIRRWEHEVMLERMRKRLDRGMTAATTKLESTVRHLGIEVDDVLEMAEQTEV
ncbi:hypothetical protein AEMCBJ_21220 [Cupriavidus necator]